MEKYYNFSIICVTFPFAKLSYIREIPQENYFGGKSKVQRKFFALLLCVICLMVMTLGTVSAAPAELMFEYSFTVDGDGNVIEPRAVANVNCGLTNTSGSNYYAWATGSSSGSVSVSVYLYKDGSQIGQASNSGTGSVTARTSTRSLSSGTYTVRGYATNSSGTNQANTTRII